MGTTEKVAKYVVDFKYKQIPEKGIEQAKYSIVDTIGVALVGATEPLGVIMADYIEERGGNPEARVLGTGFKTSLTNAALANGTFAHADDYDDVGGMGHVGAVLVPTVLAIGENKKLSGKQILEAYAVGYEVGTKLAGSMGEIGYFHATSLFGTLCAAVVAGKLLGLDVAQTRGAMGMAASMSSGIMQNFGTFAKPTHAGHAAASGIEAALLASKGFCGDLEILEGARGFFSVFGGEGAAIGRMADIGNPMSLVERGVHIKPWPDCAGNHAALTSIFCMIDKYNIKPQQVEAINVLTSIKPPATLIRENPQYGLEGKFSLQYNLAAALVDRKIDLASFTDKKIARPMIQELMKKVTVAHNPAAVDLPAKIRGGADIPRYIISLKLKNGKTISDSAFAGKALHGEEIYDKYRENAKIGGVSTRNIKRSVELIKNLEGLKDVTELMDLVS